MPAIPIPGYPSLYPGTGAPLLQTAPTATPCFCAGAATTGGVAVSCGGQHCMQDAAADCDEESVQHYRGQLERAQAAVACALPNEAMMQQLDAEGRDFTRLEVRLREDKAAKLEEIRSPRLRWQTLTVGWRRLSLARLP